MARGQAAQDLKVDRARFMAPERGVVRNEPEYEIVNRDLPSALKHLDILNDRATEVSNRLASYADRLGGSVPEPGAEAVNGKPSAAGLVNELHLLIQRLDAGLSWISLHVDRIGQTLG